LLARQWASLTGVDDRVKKRSDAMKCSALG